MASQRERSYVTSPLSLKMLSTMALGPKDWKVLSGEDWEKRQKLQLEEKSALIEGDASVLVSMRQIELIYCSGLKWLVLE